MFIDAQNVYRSARETFRPGGAWHGAGQFSPVALARLLVARDRGSRRLAEVRAYSGLPSAHRDRRTYAAARRQFAAWRAEGATVVTRPLRYPPGFPRRRPEEKGIDVKLAVDLVALAHDNAFDVAIVFSSDSDLAPALELVLARYPNKGVRVAAWQGRKRLVARAAGRSVFCHFLDERDYRSVADSRDYTRRS